MDASDALAGRGDVCSARQSSNGEDGKQKDVLLEDDAEEFILAKNNAHCRDARIAFFERDHRYEIDGVSAKRSVTSLVGIPFSKFDASASASRIARRIVAAEGKDSVPIVLKQPRTPSDKQYCEMALRSNAKTSNDVEKAVRDVWERSTHEGTRLHRAIELHLNGEAVPDSYTAIEYRKHYLQDFLAYVKSEGFECYRTEWIVYSDEVSLAGSIDCVMRKRVGTCSTTGEALYEYYIFDWKRSKRIYYKSFGNGGKRMGKYKPFDQLPDCNFSKYSLQLNVYRHILETHYGLNIKGMFLFVFHPWNTSYVKIEVNRMERHTRALFRYARPPIIILIPEKLVSVGPSDDNKGPHLTGASAVLDLELRLGNQWTHVIRPEITKRVLGRAANVHIYTALPKCVGVCIITREVCNLENVIKSKCAKKPDWSFAMQGDGSIIN